MRLLKGATRDLGSIAAVVVLMLLVGLLPPDTSLREVEARGVLRACLPTTYPPLVTGDPERPGIDVELLEAVAERMGVRLLLSPVDAMGRDFNPRNWNVTRAKCELLAGGVVDSPLTRSFLDIGPPYAEAGWALLAPAPLEGIEGRTLGALTLVSGLDRIGLSGYLRARDVTVRISRTAEELTDGIASGALDGGITEGLLARWLAAREEWWVSALPDELGRYRLALGLWKGDLTLKREIVAAFREIEADGTLAAILDRYGATPIGGGAALPAL
jgi:polar amino acid transport system substrate-binding protein/cystine transport system substrate-binding protein/membrane-bound lytic murein transglycosylase F